MRGIRTLCVGLILAVGSLTYPLPQSAEAGWLSRMMPKSWQKKWVKPEPRRHQLRPRRPRMDGPSRRRRALDGRNTTRENSAWDSYQDQVTGDALKRGAESLTGTEDERSRTLQRYRPGLRTMPRQRQR